MEMPETEHTVTKRPVWNAGTVGAKRALKPKQIWEIRFYLNQRRRLRRALFDLAIDSKLRGCDLVQMKIGDLVSGGQIRTRAAERLCAKNLTASRLGFAPPGARVRCRAMIGAMARGKAQTHKQFG